MLHTQTRYLRSLVQHHQSGWSRMTAATTALHRGDALNANTPSNEIKESRKGKSQMKKWYDLGPLTPSPWNIDKMTHWSVQIQMPWVSGKIDCEIKTSQSWCGPLHCRLCTMINCPVFIKSWLGVGLQSHHFKVEKSFFFLNPFSVNLFFFPEGCAKMTKSLKKSLVTALSLSNVTFELFWWNFCA